MFAERWAWVDDSDNVKNPSNSTIELTDEFVATYYQIAREIQLEIPALKLAP